MAGTVRGRRRKSITIANLAKVRDARRHRGVRRDVLAKEGRTKEAMTKHDEAIKYAPNWKDLIAARETAGNRGLQ